MDTTTMDLTAALALAAESHADQLDKAGNPYIGHIHRVVDTVPNPDQKLAAALHDLLEDTPLTADDLRERGCPDHVLEAVVALTRRSGEDYEDFVARAAQNPIARVVKRADIADNAKEERLQLLPEEDARRLRLKYVRAVEILDAVDSL